MQYMEELVDHIYAFSNIIRPRIQRPVSSAIMRANSVMAVTIAVLLVCCDASPHQELDALGEYSAADVAGQKLHDMDLLGDFNLNRKVRETEEIPFRLPRPIRDEEEIVIDYIDPVWNRWIFKNGRFVLDEEFAKKYNENRLHRPYDE